MTQVFLLFFYIFVGPRSILWSHWLPLFWTSCDPPNGFQSQGGSLARILTCLHVVNLSVTSGATPAFSTNRDKMTTVTKHLLSKWGASTEKLSKLVFRWQGTDGPYMIMLELAADIRASRNISSSVHFIISYLCMADYMRILKQLEYIQRPSSNSHIWVFNGLAKSL